MSIAIRPAGIADIADVDQLLRENFPRAAEAELVARLARDGDLVLVMVAADDDTGEIAGLVAFSRMAVDAGALPVPAVALAPIAVAHAHRRHGIGDLLIRAGLDWLARAGVVLVFVLGDPAFYGRFGFGTELAEGFDSPYAGPHFMALGLGGTLRGRSGRAAHAPAFAALGEGA